MTKESDKVKTRLELFGAPRKGQSVGGPGLTLEQFGKVLESHRLKTTTVHVDDSVKVESVREAFVKNLNSRGDLVLVNYQRKLFEPLQTGGGHISPIGAYDEATDSFLIMDVNPAKAPWVWVKAELLVKAMNTKDGEQYRGYVLVSE